MAKQMMIYDTAVPVSHTRHGGWSIEAGADFGFSRGVNSVPLTAVEIPAAAGEYAVIFAGQEDAVVPAVLLGMRGEENLYLGADGGWKARYVPAFLRRYPFIFAGSDDGKTFRLCIDESFAGFNQAGRGQPLYEERKPSKYTERMLNFLQQYQLEFQRTQAFCARLRELNLLAPMRAQVSLPSGERIQLGGFMVVDRARLKTLPAPKLAELVKSDELELIYGHLHSLRHFENMRERLAQTPPLAHAAAPQEPADKPANSPKAKKK